MDPNFSVLVDPNKNNDGKEGEEDDVRGGDNGGINAGVIIGVVVGVIGGMILIAIFVFVVYPRLKTHSQLHEGKQGIKLESVPSSV